jgi:hypothetical protein
MKTKTAMLLIMLSSYATAQLPKEPTRFWTKGTITLATVDLAAKSADYYYTMRVYSEQRTTCGDIPAKGYECWKSWTAYETDPLARPFVSRGRGPAAIFFAGAWAMDVGASYLMRKRSSRWKHMPFVVGILDNSVGASYSAYSGGR